MSTVRIQPSSEFYDTFLLLTVEKTKNKEKSVQGMAIFKNDSVDRQIGR